ncbi:hypothetical protein J8281_12200 [Aquimarina sp. U1-2]|uniref:hypothetical protein n=1 Tax=Aquimarina sp. U1-2 TaxID=2823141 RepID=UPI001AECF1F6|nr:hypothetical protein [Aquimarina sp. U1-2]MBP2832949.1 hypothetical protein [Aquimarina sp. U1-2]
MMKRILKLKSIATVFIFTLFLMSCSSDDNDAIQGPDPDTNLELIVNTTNAGSDERNINRTTASLSSNVTVNVTFTSDEPMRRLYIAKSENGGAYEPFQFEEGTVDEKADGSIDLVSDNRTSFTFNIPFDTPSNANGTVTYLVWATTGRGDFRDVTKRNSIDDTAFGVITFTAGNGATSEGIQSFSQTMLAAPLGDGTSNSFISLFNNTVYRIDQGEEFAAFWDFGYYYGLNGNASFASAQNYPDNIIDIPALTNVPDSELNTFYFATSTIDFNSVTTRADLDGITQSSSQRINNMAEGDVIEFVDSYGNKGVIRVTDIVGTDGVDGEITFDVKVQTNFVGSSPNIQM